MFHKTVKTFIRPYGCRSFSSSRIWETSEKEKEIVKPPEGPQSHLHSGTRTDFIPSEYEKTVLVLSGRFKSKDSIPPRISLESMENAKSRLRIRVSNILMVASLMLCGYYVWKGKKRAREGENFNTMYFEKERQAKAAYEKSHQA